MRHSPERMGLSPLGKSWPDQTPVARIMSREVYVVHPHEPTRNVSRLLLEHDLSGVPVVDHHGRVVGVVSKTDLLRDAGEVRSVGEIMTERPVTLGSTASISASAATMIQTQVHRLPVTDDEGRLAGIVTSMDILRWLAVQDGYADHG